MGSDLIFGKAISIFASRNLEVKTLTTYQRELINSKRITQIYLDQISSRSIGVGLVQLIVGRESQALKLVRELMERTKAKIVDPTEKQIIIELVESVLVRTYALNLQKLSGREFEGEALNWGCAPNPL